MSFTLLYKLIVPGGGWGNSNLGVSSAVVKMRQSFADPSHPAYTKVNFMSKEHAHMTFWVVICFLPLNGICLFSGNVALT